MRHFCQWELSSTVCRSTLPGTNKRESVFCRRFQRSGVRVAYMHTHTHRKIDKLTHCDSAAGSGCSRVPPGRKVEFSRRSLYPSECYRICFRSKISCLRTYTFRSSSKGFRETSFRYFARPDLASLKNSLVDNGKFTIERAARQTKGHSTQDGSVND